MNKRFKKNRFKNSYFWLAILGILYLILTDLNIISMDSMRFQKYTELFSTIMIVSGIWIDPTTSGFTDGDNDYRNDENVQG